MLKNYQYADHIFRTIIKTYNVHSSYKHLFKNPPKNVTTKLYLDTHLKMSCLSFRNALGNQVCPGDLMCIRHWTDLS